MRAEQPHPEGHEDRTPDAVGALIRAAADGELTDAEAAAFERLCAQRDCTKDRVRFEQTLRETCGRVMRAPPCPDALRARITTLAAETRGTGAGADAGVSAPEALAPHTRERAFWQRSPAMAAAAVVLLSVAGVLVWQAANMPGIQPPAGMTTQQVAYRDQLAGFVSAEHSRCCDDAAAATKLVHRDADRARAHINDTLGPVGFDITAASRAAPAGSSIEFWGGGDCHVPGFERSAHLRFDAVDPDGNTVRLSLFIMPDNGRLPLAEGVTHKLDAAACDKAGVRAFVWRDAGTVHLLVSEAGGSFCPAVRDLLNAPRTVAGL